MKTKQSECADFSDEENKQLLYAGAVQAIAILAQTLLLPATGIYMALVISACLSMPWVIAFSKTDKTKSFAVFMTSLIFAPIFSCFYSYVMELALNVGNIYELNKMSISS